MKKGIITLLIASLCASVLMIGCSKNNETTKDNTPVASEEKNNEKQTENESKDENESNNTSKEEEQSSESNKLISTEEKRKDENTKPENGSWTCTKGHSNAEKKDFNGDGKVGNDLDCYTCQKEVNYANSTEFHQELVGTNILCNKGHWSLYASECASCDLEEEKGK